MESSKKLMRWILLIPIITVGILTVISSFFQKTPVTHRSRHTVTGANASTMIIMMVVFAVLMICFIIFLKKVGSPTKVKNGIPASAKILAVKDTGIQINHNPVLRLELEIQPADALPYHTQTKITVPERTIGDLYPGATIHVLYEAQKPERIEIIQIDHISEPTPYSNAK